MEFFINEGIFIRYFYVCVALMKIGLNEKEAPNVLEL